MNKDKVIYNVVVEDVCTVANEVLGRAPTVEETRFVEEKIGEHIQWFAVIEFLLQDFKEKSR